jgi:preprotein translocase subunit YajC
MEQIGNYFFLLFGFAFCFVLFQPGNKQKKKNKQLEKGQAGPLQD